MQDYTTHQEVTTLIRKANMQDSVHTCIHTGCSSGINNLGSVVCSTARECHCIIITKHTWADFIEWRRQLHPHVNTKSDSLTAVYASFMHWYMSAYKRKKVRRRASLLKPPPQLL
jgi:hypothetical protein